MQGHALLDIVGMCSRDTILNQNLKFEEPSVYRLTDMGREFWIRRSLSARVAQG